MKKLITFGAVLSIAAFAVVALADHSWGGYHWARTANPFNLKLGDNMSAVWDSYLATASNDWSVSSVLDTTVVSGQTSPKNCKPVSGKVQVCNSKYGKNGWLGVASVWVSGSHIVQGTVKMNDTYFNTAKYNTPAWRNLVLCQEIGHTFGLDHQDEDFNNVPLGTCMDYTSDPIPNQHPNQHDYEELELIYSHADGFTTLASQALSAFSALIGDGEENSAEEDVEWGKPVKKSSDGKTSLFAKDLGKGHKVFTFVIWAE